MGDGWGPKRTQEAGSEIADIPSAEARYKYEINANVTVNFFPEEGEVGEDDVVPMEAATSGDHFKAGTRIILKDLQGPQAIYNGLPGLITHTVEGELGEGGFRISVDASKGSPVACFPLPADLLAGHSLAMEVMCQRGGNLPAVAQSLSNAIQLELKRSTGRSAAVHIHAITFPEGPAVPTIKPFEEREPGCVVQVAGQIDTSPEAQRKLLQLEALAEERARGPAEAESACCAVM